MTTTTNLNEIHPFERSGLGAAPFTFVTVFSYQKHTENGNVDGVNNANKLAGEIAASYGVRGGICQHCGMALMNNYIIKSKDGKYSVVGCDCVLKVADERRAHMDPLVMAVKREISKQNAEKLRLKGHAARATVNSLLADPAVKSALMSQPHPNTATMPLRARRCWTTTITSAACAATAAYRSW